MNPWEEPRPLLSGFTDWRFLEDKRFVVTSAQLTRDVFASVSLDVVAREVEWEAEVSPGSDEDTVILDPRELERLRYRREDDMLGEDAFGGHKYRITAGRPEGTVEFTVGIEAMGEIELYTRLWLKEGPR